MKTRAIRLSRRQEGSRGHERPRGGFSLTEVLVAMTLLSVILMGLARVTFQMASASKTNDTVAKRDAVLVQEANKFNAMSYDSLATVSTTEKTYNLYGWRFQVHAPPRDHERDLQSEDDQNRDHPVLRHLQEGFRLRHPDEAARLSPLHQLLR
jgi:prepilin-type N-terminal cleavage/methylation domain-containing protein